MRNPLNQIAFKWERDPPTFTLRDCDGESGDLLSLLRHRGFLCETLAAAACRCTQCGVHREVIYQTDLASGTDVPFIVCMQCGPTRLHRDQVEQLAIDTPRMLRHLFADIAETIQTIVDERLWNIGRCEVAGRRREFWFVRGLTAYQDFKVVSRIQGHPRAILFTPTRSTANVWQSIVENVVIAIEEVMHSSDSDFELCQDAIQDLVIESFPADPPVATRKRSSRATKIEVLRKELKAHLRSAYEHAVRTSEEHGYPDLLPRPTQSQLARATSMTPSDVSRCLKDTQADELRLLWSTAINIEAILRLRRGPPMLK